MEDTTLRAVASTESRVLPILAAFFLFLMLFSGEAASQGRASSSATDSRDGESARHFRAAGSYDRAFAARPELLDKVRSSNSLAQVAGWFEYDFSIESGGWHELVLLGAGNEVEYTVIDRATREPVVRKVGSHAFDGKQDKVSNFHLPSGKYTLKLQREFWTGFGDVRGFWLRPSPQTLGGRMRVSSPAFAGVYRSGQCGQLEIQYGPSSSAVAFDTILVDALNSRTIRTDRMQLPATPQVATHTWVPPCDSPGTFVMYFRNAAEGLNAKDNRDVQQVVYQVFDTSRPTARQGTLKALPPERTLVHTIDPSRMPPDYESGTGRVVTSAAGSYRESDIYGWGRRQHGGKPPPSWFAYVLRNLEAQQPYLVEIDYPDDERRTFTIALREARPLSYPVAGGVDSGGEFRLTNRTQTQTLLFWPRATDARIVFMPVHDGERAAASAIRVYRVDALPALAAPAGGRRFWNWYEEGSNFLSMYGAPDHWLNAGRIGAERWADTAAHMGITTLVPTVVIYEFGLFPSRVNRYFTRPAAPDMLKQILLAAESRGVEVIPELHPRADEINWTIQGVPDPKPTVLRSSSGEWVKGVPTFFNPLHPLAQGWYLDLIGELVDNYRDSPALKGVSLRVMGWRNPTLHNFYSLDWGYDDFTIGEFVRDTGIAVPGGSSDSSRFASRHRFLTTKERERWIAWRTDKVTQIVTRIRDRVRKGRPDLKVYLPVFPMTVAGSTYFQGTDWIREAGLDVKRLGAIDGVVLVNALHGYGRRFDQSTNQNLRGNLMDPSRSGALSDGTGAAFLPYAVYFEAMQSVASNEELGFPSSTRRTWMSAVVNPAGRNYLERFAVLLARHDALLLGDGGNTYTIGQPELRAFLSEFVRLPAERFTRKTQPGAAVAAWELRRAEDFHFYVVNATSMPSSIAFSISGTNVIEHLSTGARIPIQGGTLSVNLEPFELRAFRAAPGSSVTVVQRPR